MIIRIDKCITFGIKKLYTKSVQYLPKLLINGVLVPCVKMGDSFRYLGRYFDFTMSNHEHMTELTSLVQDLMNGIDMKPLHPKNKLLLYSRYVLSKFSWHFIVADISKTWIIEIIDSIVSGFIRKWFDIPISGTLINIFLDRNIFGLNICPPSVKFIQCQTVLRYSLKSLAMIPLKIFGRHQAATLTFSTMYINLLKKFLKISVLIKKTSCYNSVWSSVQSNLPKNFTIRYINNSLAIRKNLFRWGSSQSPDCSFCLNSESLLHVVAGCKHYLEHFTWRHDSILNFIATSLQTAINDRSSLYADKNVYSSPSIITGDTFRPDPLFLIHSKCLYILELTVGFECNLCKNVNEKNTRS